MSDSSGLGLGMRAGLGAANAPARASAPAGNEAWASKRAPVGLKLLQKMGWADGKGLGANEDGRVSHIRVKRKTGGIGVGATAADIQRGWETPGAVATGLNDILAKLSAVAAPPTADVTDAADATTTASAASPSDDARVSGDAKDAKAEDAEQPKKRAKTVKKRKGGRGFYERKRALKSVGRYSKQELAEIFGAVGDQDSSTPSGLNSTGSTFAHAKTGEKARGSTVENDRSVAKVKTVEEEDAEAEAGSNAADKIEKDEDDAADSETPDASSGAGESAGERAALKKVKKEVADVISSMPGLSGGGVKKSKKKKKKKSKEKKEKLTWSSGEVMNG